MGRLGAVAIGRNEGQRLVRCLKSLARQLPEQTPMVYVDSGSSDDSCEAARALGARVVELDLSVPFTAARARNAGFECLMAAYPQVQYVQFIDGDCELEDGWAVAAIALLEQAPHIVAVCGWRRERFPQGTLFNRICEVEWHSGAVGEISHFGGDVILRAAAFAEVQGYQETVIAAEDDELSVRLRQAGGQIYRLDCDSTIHDANMQTLWQWWQRGMRGGYAYAQVFSIHGDPPERKFEQDVARIWLWGLTLPVVAIATTPLTQGLSLLLLLRYPLTAAKVTYATHRQGFPWDYCVAWGISCTLSVFPGLFGALKFHRDNLSRAPRRLIEYK